MTDVWTELEAWTRKGYGVMIEGGPWCQPGDGWHVVLSGGNRKVSVGEYDILLDDDGLPTATLTDLVREAMRLWHADATPKEYRLHVEMNGKFTSPAVGCDGVRWERWTDTTCMVYLTATNEQEAKAILRSGYTGRIIGIKETYDPNKNRKEPA